MAVFAGELLVDKLSNVTQRWFLERKEKRQTRINIVLVDHVNIVVRLEGASCIIEFMCRNEKYG